MLVKKCKVLCDVAFIRKRINDKIYDECRKCTFNRRLFHCYLSKYTYEVKTRTILKDEVMKIKYICFRISSKYYYRTCIYL